MKSYQRLKLKISCKHTKKWQLYTINGQQLKAGQYVFAKSVITFESSTRQEARTVFTDPLYRPARIDHFAVHSVPVDGSMYGHCSAVASWPQRHPDITFWGKPYQIWCRSLFECSLSNFVENISSVLLTADCILEEEHVLLVVPFIS